MGSFNIITTNYRCSFIFEDFDLIRFENIIREHHLLYVKLYGFLKPKHHFLVHYPTAIKKCGPLKYLWCMRFEAKHKESKMYFNNITSRVNPCHSLSIKSALKFASFLLKHEDDFESDIFLNSSKTLNLSNEKIFYKFNNPNINFENCEVSDEVIFKGTKYKANYYLATKAAFIEVFKIKRFIFKNKNIYVLCNEININKFDSHLQAYEIGTANQELYLIQICDFITKPSHLYPMNNGNVYLRLKYIS